ncbi:Protein SODIUM POTASSIUM ROOT DEFECTIVE 1 like [Actinidia chinensis var. chinensis]|uniref:Protein SODIUM POTASSIUM ROOT DEFECTIVE 1 like n=1 Tax=Actinidia chinensis var. chinensis TaxID=1590841 RepID=A0A2R6QJY5_ACTCC|nr:Protein SODIUM POTASSIUM ROOT DEFECTIVE 1 like [Actinidia chinensis var. chinensis]
MDKPSKPALMYAENLTLPSFQVIVISANLGCSFCRQRVSHILSKITGLREYTVDVRNKQVMVKGDVHFSCNTRHEERSPRKERKKYCLPYKFSIRYLRPTCFV